MKKYIIPTTDVITIATAQLIAASGGGPGANDQQNPGKKAPRFHQPYEEEDEEEEDW